LGLELTILKLICSFPDQTISSCTVKKYRYLPALFNGKPSAALALKSNS
jgi:hypothetical protein